VLGCLLVAEWVANCTGCGAKGEYNPEKTGKSLSKHIINGKICGLFNNTPKQLALGVTAASEIAANGRATAAASPESGNNSMITPNSTVLPKKLRPAPGPDDKTPCSNGTLIPAEMDLYTYCNCRVG
jgi:hypothetical protein